MIRNFLFIFLLLMSLSASSRHTAEWVTFEVGKLDVWNGVGFIVDQELMAEGNYLLGEETYFIFPYQLNEYVSLFPYFGFARWRDDDNHLCDNMMCAFSLGLTTPEFWTLKLNSRTTAQWWDPLDGQTWAMWRQKFRLSTSWGITDFHISPFWSEEVLFYDMPKVQDSNLFRQLRSCFGISFHPIPSHRQFAVYTCLMLRHHVSDKSESWDPESIFVTTFEYLF